MTDAMRARFEEFRDLGPNWDSYGAVPITPEAIEAGLRLYAAVGVKPVVVVPLSDGGVQLEWPEEDRYFTADWEPGSGWGYYEREFRGDHGGEANGIDFDAVLARVERFLAEREIDE